MKDGSFANFIEGAGRARLADEPLPVYECDYALLRPDQVVVWRGNHIPEDGAPLIARVAGW